ncbi:MAG: YidC/Oxa1 family membrane protein insertase [Oscillospiraceae bacterium]|jgi:YidC/Oxa1 family membrane protein insertase|nr:YidC/Oxa1 family membrane protein insertase [Oscillospiraceae bacterium]
MADMFELIYRYLGIPFGWVLTLLLSIVPNYVLVLIVFTLMTRCIMIPTNLQQKRAQAQGQRLQPKIRRIQQKYAGNQQKIQQETSALYSREGAASMNAGCLPMLISLPIMYGIAGAIYYPLKYPLGLHHDFPGVIEKLEAAFLKLKALDPAFSELVGNNASIASKQVGVMEHIQALLMNPYHEVREMMNDVPAAVIERIHNFDFNFLGISLGLKPEWNSWSILVPIASLVFSVGFSVYSMIMQRKQNPGQQQQNLMMMGCMTLGMPLMMFWFAMTMPVAIGIYWATGSFFALVQGIIFSHMYTPSKVLARMMVDDTINRCAREKEQRAKRSALPAD